MIGCHWNREPLDLVRQAGLQVTRADRRFLGVFHSIEARLAGVTSGAPEPPAAARPR